jgi:hypothetical protein
MKIYDCFPFFNELDLLEIRFEELYNSVDYFVLSESNLSHSGKPKDYIFEKNKERYSKYLDKIIHVKVDDMPVTNDAWVRERYQRFSILRGLKQLQSDDIVIVSDLDEIPRAAAIDAIKTDTNDYNRYILNSPMFQYKINYMMIVPDVKVSNIMVTRGRVFTNPQQEREYTFSWVNKPLDTIFLDHAGWHFSYFGDNQHAITKIQNFAHRETDNKNMIENHNIDYFIKNKCGHHGPLHPEKYEYVIVDDYFPDYIVKNLEKWNHMIIPNAEKHVTDLY